MPFYKLSKFKADNFRNLESQIIEFSENINCIFGSNGNGKTNLLEAIYFLVNHKSFRKKTGFPQIVSIDCEKPEIIFTSVFASNENKKISYSGKVNPESSEWYLNSKPAKRKIEAPIVFINPFDSYSFHNQASFRRDWFNHFIGMLDPNYRITLKELNHALKFRNTLLHKKPRNYLDQIKAIDTNLAPLYLKITNLRQVFLRDFEELCSTAFYQLFSESHHLAVRLETKWSGINERQIFEKLQENLKKDLILGFTKDGVHKDDYTLLFDGINSYEYCSLGQQKMSYLSLLFAYIELFRYKFTSFPIVLIDDVSGELDQIRWSNLIRYLDERKFQVLITTANEKFKDELSLAKNVKQIDIQAGFVKQE